MGDSDGFDGFTHAHGFLTDRPLFLASHAVIATIVASVAACLGWLALSLAIWFSGRRSVPGWMHSIPPSDLRLSRVLFPEASLGEGGGAGPAGGCRIWPAG
ncbi:MAG: hypothetical protein Ct9H300mP1_12090 [Planctomycetaceae bacterium]|nr:MAG: hypothetical protein Ct9H300mP1_12090 [Planctomycetaceae bacterium]